MTLAQLVAIKSELFYEQVWWKDQAFAEADRAPLLTMPSHVVGSTAPENVGFLPFATTLAHLYVLDPKNELWCNPLWTADLDDHGNRVFVGCVGMDGIDQFQVHRALDYAERCRVLVWT